MPQQKKISVFLAADRPSSTNAGQARPTSRPKQARMDALQGVVHLSKMSGYAPEEELQRLLALLDDSSKDVLLDTMKQLACFELSVDQV